MSSRHQIAKSPPPITYSAQPPVIGASLTCSRCKRVHPYPVEGGRPIRCECGWWYENLNGLIQEDFKPRLGV
ncbi:MAG: hypothetical protein IAI50_13540 [Candidatus Eremiobacteraeota bacterium]|nr:hypothetical protein [Candidatus Eremiobacteraeota bacterium]